MNGEASYLRILSDISKYGVDKEPARDGEAVNETIMLPCRVFEHNMSQGFPALTTRRVAFKSSMVELEGFLHGITSKQWYINRGCHFWDHWACPAYVNDAVKAGKEKSTAQREENELGPIYGYQWRFFNDDGGADGDQLNTVVEKLKKSPYDRRLIVSAWNPLQIKWMALPPCHILFQLVTYQDKMDLIWYQRSVDMQCGAPHNITFYATMLILMAKTANMKANNLFGIFADAHIYKNHIEGTKELLARTPGKLPSYRLSERFENGEADLFDFTHKDIELIDYNPGPKIKFEVTI